MREQELNFEGIERVPLSVFTEKAYLDYSIYVIVRCRASTAPLSEAVFPAQTGEPARELLPFFTEHLKSCERVTLCRSDSRARAAH